MFRDWTIEEGQYGPRMVMKGPWSPTALDAARRKGVKEIELNYAKGWKDADLLFLRQLPDLQALEIIDWTRNDVGVVNDLASLRRLKVYTYCKTELRFTQLPNLEECSLDWRPKASSLFEHRGLRDLFINKYPGKNLRAFSEMRSLRSLSLASPNIETCAGIETLTGLTFLGLALARRLTTLAGIEALTSLTGLEINTCRKVRDISPVGALRNLRELQLCNDGEIESIKPLSGLTNLETFLFYESTNIVDGDLSPLKNLPRLKTVAFMERRHYSHGRSDLPNS